MRRHTKPSTSEVAGSQKGPEPSGVAASVVVLAKLKDGATHVVYLGAREQTAVMALLNSLYKGCLDVSEYPVHVMSAAPGVCVAAPERSAAKKPTKKRGRA